METYRYMYDYSTHKMYVELFDKNKRPYWQYLDANFYDKKRYKSIKLFTTPSVTNVYFTREEIALALAYNMSFYKNGSLSWQAQKYFETLKQMIVMYKIWEFKFRRTFIIFQLIKISNMKINVIVY